MTDSARLLEEARRVAEHMGYCPHSTAEDELAGQRILELAAELQRLREENRRLRRECESWQATHREDVATLSAEAKRLREALERIAERHIAETRNDYQAIARAALDAR